MQLINFIVIRQIQLTKKNVLVEKTVLLYHAGFEWLLLP